MPAPICIYLNHRCNPSKLHNIIRRWKDRGGACDYVLCVLKRLSWWGNSVHVVYILLLVLHPNSHRNTSLSPTQLLRFCQEIAGAMQYLSKKGFIHRDLAARNILLDRDSKCKVGSVFESLHVLHNYAYISIIKLCMFEYAFIYCTVQACAWTCVPTCLIYAYIITHMCVYVRAFVHMWM